ncbi:MAG TPA: hypothetical protein ENJ79_08895 [Gammaproteobacteria bacterium]|nr:hypothetical protein [Gammaproteobacteria bacterium]
MACPHEKTASKLIELESPDRPTKPTETVQVKCSKAAIHRKTHRIPEIKFEDQRMTSFSGLVLCQALFTCIGFRQQLNGCFRHLKVSPIFGHGVVVLLLMIHLLLGYRRAQDMRHYADDPMVHRPLGLKRPPDVATLSWSLAGLDAASVANMRRFNRQRVLEQLGALDLARIALYFDDSVLCMVRFAEGAAVGFKRKKKGQRSYYPLFCTIAQTGQVLDIRHRPGNVHDSNGAKDFIFACVREIKAILPRARMEVRMDSAFFSDDIVGWKPAKRNTRYCFVFLLSANRQQYKSPVQLDLFVPYEYSYDFEVIVTDKPVSAKKVLGFHGGRGVQEGLLAAVLAYNLNREMRMLCYERTRNTTEKRAPLWYFEQLGTVRRKLIRRAGRPTRPKGSLTLIMSANPLYNPSCCIIWMP